MSASESSAGLRVVLEGASFVVVDKPAGLLSVPGKGEDKADCAASRVRAMFPGATGPLIVHRLDMDTSGLLVLGLTPDAQRHLSAQFEARTVEKRYTALVDGLLYYASSGVIGLAMRLDPDNRPYQVLDHWQGREAITQWRVLAHEIDRTRVEFIPKSGRTHQLRLHAATPRDRGGLGHAIVGDVLYGTGYTGPQSVGALHPADRLMLHASVLCFNDPDTNARVTAQSAPDF